jgi:ribosomal-protein-alanine N-acetyltransferase
VRRLIAPRVLIRPPLARDREEFLAAMRASRKLHRGWSAPPRTPAAWAAFLRRYRRPTHVAYLACRREDGRIVGAFMLMEIVRGQLRGAYLGYYAVAAFTGRGYMTEALGLVLRRAFGPLRLHRVEANIQPGNARSIALVRRCGFRREGLSRRYLKVAGRWRDHERWALIAEEWRGGILTPRSSADAVRSMRRRWSRDGTPSRSSSSRRSPHTRRS